MNVVIAFVRAGSARIAKFSIHSVKVLQHALWTRWGGLLALSLVFSGTGHAGIEQVWQYTVSTLPGQVFPTLPAAENAMRGVSVAASYLRLETSAISEEALNNSYSAPEASPLRGSWMYPAPNASGSCLGSSGAVASMIAAQAGANDPCPVDLVPYGSPSAPCSTCALGSVCGIPQSSIETTTQQYSYIVSTHTYPQGVLLCTEVIPRPQESILGVREASCPLGYSLVKTGPDWNFRCVDSATATITGALTQYCGPTKGNPCNVATGDKVQAEHDGSGALPLNRTYHSINQLDIQSKMGFGWIHNYSARLITTGSQLTGAVRASGYAEPLYKRPNTNNFVSRTGSGVQVEPNGSGWVLYQTDGSKENYDATGRLISLVDKAGNVTTLAYDSLSGLLTQVTDAFGHSLTFSYDISLQYLLSITDGAGQAIQYGYTGNNLTRVTYPDGSYRSYHYENASFPNHLTGITDENGSRYATYAYDTLGRAVSTEHAGSAEKVTLQYNADGTTTVTDAVGQQEVFTFSVNGPGIRDVTGIAKGGVQTSNTYTVLAENPQHRVSQSTDELGRQTTFTYDTHHLISKTEAAGTAQARTTTYQYLSEYNNLPTLISSPSVYGTAQKQKSITYSTAQLPTQITESGYTPGGVAVSRSVSMQYNSLGQVTQIDGPRSDVSDVTTFAYYANDTTQGFNRGQLQRVTNALGQSTTYNSYDAAGRLLSMTDANGLQTQYSYDLRGRVLSVTKTPPGGLPRVTRTTYDFVGQVSSVTMPDGIVLSYTYDAAHQLISVTDNLGDKVHYTYDLKGRRTNTSTFDPNGTLVRSLDTTYDAWDRVNSVNNAGSVTQTVFDAVGELVSETNPKNAITTHQYDALARMMKTVDALAGNTAYSYDVNDRVTQVTAPNNAATQYSYDDLGRLTKEISPDRGTTVFSYDAAGNLLSHTDARNLTVTYSYDALNRVVTASYPTASENITYTYDIGTGCTYGIGKLCNLTDASGSTRYGYDAFGNLTMQVHTELNIAYTTAYTYDAGDRLLSITYPGGRVVNYTRDAIGRISAIATTLNGATTTITSARSYSADGALNTQTWGNGKVETRTYDLQGRLTQLKVGTDTRSYTYDANGNVTQKVSTPETGNYTYDVLDRLTADNNGTNTTFGYDANGNRTLLGSTVNVYTANSNRLTKVGTTALTLDAAGNTLINGTWTYSYSNAGQLTQAKNGTTVAGSYIYNALRQRTRKIVGTTTTVYHYDLAGHLIAETQSTGPLIRSYVYADDAPVAQIESVTVLPPDNIIDNTQATFTGTWATATSITGYYGSNYRTHAKGTGTNKVVWTPNVPSSGTYQVYARWVAASTHASNAPFTVKYNGGSATVTKSQRTSNGQWVLLGSYAFSAGTAGNVTLTDNADGTVIADAIKLVATSGGTMQEVLRSIHTDHLNTPRLATNASGTIIWRWEGKAFGDTAPNEDPDLDTIKTTINLRYPGQYADAETGLFYNWNRYYDPKTGRYTTSDPIGLAGGLNTFSYVFDNPLRWIDPIGLFCTNDFAKHYFSGGGTTIDLGSVGLLGAFKSSPSVQSSVSSFKQNVTSRATAKAKSLCKSCDTGTKSTSFSTSDKDVTNVTGRPCLFAVGHSTLFRSAKCGITADCDNRTFSFGCSLGFKVRDKFEDPLDIGIEIPGGTIYRINADWSDSVVGYGSL